MVNLRKILSPDFTQYKNVIIRSGVRVQRVYKEALRFLEKDFGDRRVAIFLSSAEAGNPKSYNDAITKFIKNVLAKYPHIKLIAAEVFGGRIKIFELTVSDDRDMKKVMAWAEELLGKKLTN